MVKMDFDKSPFREFKDIVPGFFDDTSEQWYGYLNMEDYQWIVLRRQEFVRILDEATNIGGYENKVKVTNFIGKHLKKCEKLKNNAIQLQKRRLQREDEHRKRLRSERSASLYPIIDPEEPGPPREYLPMADAPDVKPRDLPHANEPSTSTYEPTEPAIERGLRSRRRGREEKSSSRRIAPTASRAIRTEQPSSESDSNISDLGKGDLPEESSNTEEDEPEQSGAPGGRAPDYCPAEFMSRYRAEKQAKLAARQDRLAAAEARAAASAPTASTSSSHTSPEKPLPVPPKPLTTNEIIVKREMREYLRKYDCEQYMMRALEGLDKHKAIRDSLEKFDLFIAANPR